MGDDTRSGLDILDPEVSLSGRDLLALAKWVWGMIWPHPKFGGITQGAALAIDQNISWHHISVGVSKLPVLGRRDIPCCKAYALFVDGPFQGQELQMKWRSDLPYASTETTLIAGDERALPFVIRKDAGDQAEVSDHIWFAMREGIKRGVYANYPRSNIDKRHYLKQGTYRAIIKIVSGNWSWQSPHYYVVNVPKAGRSNSHFGVSEKTRKRKWQEVNI